MLIIPQETVVQCRWVDRYSCLPNTRRGWNNGIGWKIPSELINGDGINVGDGKFM